MTQMVKNPLAMQEMWAKLQLLSSRGYGNRGEEREGEALSEAEFFIEFLFSFSLPDPLPSSKNRAC